MWNHNSLDENNSVDTDLHFDYCVMLILVDVELFVMTFDPYDNHVGYKVLEDDVCTYFFDEKDFDVADDT